MAENPNAQPTPSPAHAPEGRLDSWKEIAAYLGRGIRTVQRWEREEGLPVHRLAHEKRGSVYARREELALWWESRRLTLAAPPTPGAVDAPVAPRLERVTWTAALTSWPALSSDARLIAYVSDAGQDGTTPQIWIQQIGGAALRLTNGEREYSYLSFSPDDTRIIFTASDDSGPSVYEVTTLGGEPRILQRGASRGRISPDGRWFACVPLDAVGIRSVLHQVPLGTYLGWNATAAGFFKGQPCGGGLTGGYIPFAKSKAERLASNDPRLSLEERYGTQAGYGCLVRKVADRQVSRRFLRREDADRLVKEASAVDNLAGIPDDPARNALAEKLCRR